MPKRILTVSYIIERDTPYPFIRLRGRWLALAGFTPQDQIEVDNTDPGVLIINKIENQKVRSKHR